MSSILKFELKDIPDKQDVKLVKIIGELDASNAESLRVGIEPCIDMGMKNLVCDLSDLKFIDSIGNVCFFRLHLRAKKNNGGLIFFGANKNIKEVLELTGITKMIPTFDTFQQAIVSCQG